MSDCSPRATILSLVLLTSLGAAAAVWWWGNSFAEPLPEATARFQRRHPPIESSRVGDVYAKVKALMQYNFKGRPAIEQLIQDLDLTADLPHAADGSLTTEGLAAYEALIRSITDGVSLKVEIEDPEFELVALTVRHLDPALAVKIANKLVENYMTLTRKEMEDTLLEQKKFFDTEINRYRRKVSELESARLRFTMSTGGISLDDPHVTLQALREPDHKAARDKAVRRLNRLRELSKDQPLGDLVVLELLKLEAAVDAAEKAMADAERTRAAREEAREVLLRNLHQIRADYDKIVRELKEAQEQLAFWSKRLEQAQMGLTLSVSDRGLQLSFVERATLKHPVKSTQASSKPSPKPAR